MGATVKYLDFILVGDTGKTFRYEVKGIQSGVNLGLIKWYAPWRRYVFFPVSDTLFDANCLQEIYQFIGHLMLKRNND